MKFPEDKSDDRAWLAALQGQQDRESTTIQRLLSIIERYQEAWLRLYRRVLELEQEKEKVFELHEQVRRQRDYIVTQEQQIQELRKETTDSVSSSFLEVQKGKD